MTGDTQHYQLIWDHHRKLDGRYAEVRATDDGGVLVLVCGRDGQSAGIGLDPADRDAMAGAMLGSGRDLPPIILDGYEVDSDEGVESLHWSAGRSHQPGMVFVQCDADMTVAEALELARCVAALALEEADGPADASEPDPSEVAELAAVLENAGDGYPTFVAAARAAIAAGYRKGGHGA